MSPNENQSLTRRQFLKGAAQALTVGMVAQALPGLGNAPAGADTAFPARPNILMLLTDQERSPRNWPDGWAESHLTKARKRLLDNGLDFSRAFCSASMCSPSRGCLFTGLYPAQHGVVLTLTEDGENSDNEVTLSPQLRNLGNLLAESGYDVQLRGKWHLSKSADGHCPTTADLAGFGFNGWVPTEAGQYLSADTFGGGCADEDQGIVDDAIAFLQTKTPASTQQTPFFLVVSLANPHDILSYPTIINDESCPESYNNTADFDMGIALPASRTDDLAKKPGVQTQARELYAYGLGPLIEEDKQLKYVNFYAYLQTIVDGQLETILQTLEDQGLTDSTLVVRTADHGELGLSHDGLRQKMFNIYEECLNIPFIFSNPVLFPAARQTSAYATLVDVLPTLASLCGVPQWKWSYLPGRDLSQILLGTTTSVQDTILFTFDDEYAGLSGKPPFITEPCHIRCIITTDADGEWKYARYFDPGGVAAEEYEMYRLADGDGNPVDPLEMDNVANSASPNYAAYAAKRAALADLLAQVEAERLGPVTPPGPPVGGANLLLLGD
ncbi:sulfatase-like hydrolase/transferase [Desulfovibrio sulfodismutans]|uniref:Sulfatase-like hydrolase/transferase n=1 Tax=Desulfolutivibrio sulfodismutans TaxID=63561 RepID=A0A7K3NJK0_9BACT|nr:sulfatase-like hydrolase/transferase [Desulfolutivibrio sulfodismutans]NDY55973.1 sulfatase-like hydrolase/transferase [Desulfolutivibrio sulfodismutans]QLA13214.1 sulfatase-like hydrolase/transferase [Desulfolutivibrio sulfodismutans DSM 3696]